MKEKNGIFYGWWIVVGVALLLTVAAPASVAVANIYQPHVTEALNISASAFAVSNTIVLGMGVFLSPIVSNLLSQKFKMWYMIGIVIYVLGLLGYSRMTNLVHLYLSSFLTGIGFIFTAIIPASMLVNKWFNKQKGLALSLAFSGLGIGGVIFSNLVTYVIEAAGWRQANLTYAIILFVVSALVMTFIIKVDPSEKGTYPDGIKPTANDNDSLANKTVSDASYKVSGPFKSFARDPFFIFLLIGAVFIGLSNNGGLGQFPPFMTELHGATRSALIVSIYSAVGIIGKLIIGIVSDKFGVRVGTNYAVVLCVVTFILALFSNNWTMAILMAIAFGLGNGIGTVSAPLVTSSMVSAENYATVYGYTSSALQLGMTFGSVFAASIANFTDSYNWAWIVVAIISALVGVCWTYALNRANKLAAKQLAK